MRYITFLMGVDVDSQEELDNFALSLTPIHNEHLKYLFIMNSMVIHFDSDLPYDELKLFMGELCKEYNFFYMLQEFPDKMALNFNDVDAKHLFDLSVFEKNIDNTDGIKFNFKFDYGDDEDEDDMDDDLVQLLKEKYLIKQEEPSLDEILEKIHQKGVSSLTIQEKAILNNYN